MSEQSRPKFDMHLCSRCGREVWVYPSDEEVFHIPTTANNWTDCGGVLKRVSLQEKNRRIAEYLFGSKYDD